MIAIVKPGETGSFRMGSTEEELSAQSPVSIDQDYQTADEQPAHPVTLTVPYAIGKFEVTNQLFADVMNGALEAGLATLTGDKLMDSSGRYMYLDLRRDAGILESQRGLTIQNGELQPAMGFSDHPVNVVTWYGAVAFTNFLSRRNNLDPVYDLASWTWDESKSGYRLPTEAEWEYAARGMERRMYTWGDAIGPAYNRYGSTHPVGAFDGRILDGLYTKDNASPFGVYDMTGNVWEWCWDWYGRAYYAASPAADPTGPSSGDDRPPYNTDVPTRVWRGGGFLAPMDSGYLRIAKRWSSAPDSAFAETGFRIAQTLR
jgi:formylglycine-generating enzyme required for sulfatase activity